MPRAYKVFDHRHGQFKSAGIGGLYELTYPTTPGSSIEHDNMFVFREQRAAVLFAHKCHMPTAVWEVEVPQLNPAPERILFSSEVDNWFVNFWEQWVQDLDQAVEDAEFVDDLLANPPLSTCLVDKMTLVKQIYTYNGKDFTRGAETYDH